MHPGRAYVESNETLTDAAWRMAKLNVGALPVCGKDNRLIGIITARDIVIKCIAKRENPAKVRARDLIDEARLWWIDADADIDEVLHEMAEHKIRRLPVLEDKELVGIISQADLAAKPGRRAKSSSQIRSLRDISWRWLVVVSDGVCEVAGSLRRLWPITLGDGLRGGGEASPV